jgi:two-component system C4-dicarboxylate transport sensor histidine kinase DctB
VDLARLEASWAGTQDAVMVVDGAGQVVLATERRWRGLSEAEALDYSSAPSSILRALRVTQDWTTLPPDAYLSGEAVMRREMRVPFQGWRLVGFTAYASVRERVNGVLALEIMGFAILLAGAFWLNSRKTRNRLVTTQRESAELRLLNARLQREIAERERMEKSLKVAEQTLAQAPSSPSWARCRPR